ncbi:MAG: cyclic pyranopterin monophosphate synthase MoaC, partial [Methyloceanibacter sp.]
MSSRLSHLNARGEAHMVDVSEKPITSRTAVAEGYVTMAPATLDMILDGTAPKGDVLATARIAGIMGAKKTSELIPLCHALALSNVLVEFSPDRANSSLRVEAIAKVDG